MTKKFKALESVKTDQGNQLSIIERSIEYTEYPDKIINNEPDKNAAKSLF